MVTGEHSGGYSQTSDRSSLVRPWQDHAGSVENAFRDGSAVVLGWRDEHAAIRASLETVRRHLSALPVETSFPGVDGLAADRQSLWVAATGIGAELCTDSSGIAHLDGDADGGARGLAMLRFDLPAATAFRRLKRELDGALLAVLGNLGLSDGLPAGCLSAMTVRYRAIRYAPSRREQAGIGIHPDGNLISALITDRAGLVVLGGPGRVEWPEPADGTVVMPGTVLTRWSGGALTPTVHAVTIRRSDPAKCSVVAFLNFADGTEVPRRASLGGGPGMFRNDVRRYKHDDMRPDGDLAGFYRERGFVVSGENGLRFRTLAELGVSSQGRPGAAGRQ